MSTFKKWAWVILILLILGGGGYVAYHFYQWQKAQDELNAQPPLKMVQGTNINPAFNYDSAFKTKLAKKYPFVYHASCEVPQAATYGKNFVVPGLQKTRSYDAVNKKIGTSTKMTPQGLTVAGDYLLITAYSADGRYNSVIYVLNKKTGAFIKTIILPGRPHAGGITYDPEAKMVWVTGSMNEGAALMSIELKTIKAYKSTKKGTPVKFHQSLSLPTVERSSTVTYYDDQLFVGFFNTFDKGVVESFRIMRHGKNRGTISYQTIKESTGHLLESYSYGNATINSQIQGIAITDDHVFMSQSYGPSDSKLYIYPISAIGNLTNKNAEKVVMMPAYLEQIYVDGAQMIAVFESAASSYARPDRLNMDRILALNVNELLNDQAYEAPKEDQ